MISKRDILIIACKVLGLVWLIWGIQTFTFAITTITALLRPEPSALWNEYASWWIPGTLAMPVIFFLSAFILLKWSKGIASLLAPEDQPVKVAIGEDWERPLYRLCLRIVGAVVVVVGTPKLIAALSLLLSRPRVTPPVLGSTWGAFFADLVYIALGIYLIGGAPLIVNIALRGSLREPDLDKTKPTTSEPSAPPSS